MHCEDSEDDASTEMQYMPVEETESIEKYELGGYHPVHIGDRLGPHGRYQVVHKLSYGGHSTVWLARDETRGCYVALKISIASDEVFLQERRMLLQLSEESQHTHGIADRRQSGIITALDSFTLEGPNGTHGCLVTEPGMCSLAASKSASRGVWLFDLAVARRITA